MTVSIATDNTIRAAETWQYEIKFQADYDSYKKRVQMYENNESKAYALSWERCTKGMKKKVEGRTEFKSKIENNPIELLKAIKEHVLNYQEHWYSMSIILDAMQTLLNTKQKENESLQDYTKRFRTARDVLELHIGRPIVLKKIVDEMNKQKVEDGDKGKIEKKAFEQFLAFLYLENADQGKYASILTGLNTQQLLGNDQYPKSITE